MRHEEVPKIMAMMPLSPCVDPGLAAFLILRGMEMANQRGNFCVSTRIHYGLGSLDFLSRLKVKRALVVSDPFMVKTGMIDQVTAPLEKAGIDYTVFDEVIPDPDISVIVKGLNVAQNISPEAVIAFGGGSAIDTAKAIIYFCRRIRGCRGETLKPALVVIPTTSGSGSEVTDFAVVTDERAKVKIPLVDKILMPNHAILDAALVRSLPPTMTADTGLDVLTHAIEAYVSVKASDFTDALAEKAIRLVFEYLPRAYKDGNDDEARVKMHNASAMAGMAFTHTSLGINHSMAHALGGRFQLPHGRINGILMPFVIDFNSNDEKTAKRYAKISELMGLNYISPIYAARELKNMVKRLLAELNVPPGFIDAGISEVEFLSSIESLAFMAMKDPCTDTNPRTPIREDLEYLLKESFYGKCRI